MKKYVIIVIGILMSVHAISGNSNFTYKAKTAKEIANDSEINFQLMKSILLNTPKNEAAQTFLSRLDLRGGDHSIQ